MGASIARVWLATLAERAATIYRSGVATCTIHA
jgi:hypothetical protein